MSYRLAMSAEISDWFADLCSSEPVTAAEVGAALVAVMEATQLSELHLVSEPSPQPAADPADPREALDLAYQSLLEALQELRRLTADATWGSAHAERMLRRAESYEATDPAVLAWLRQALNQARQGERQITARSQRVQRDVDAFRIAKETGKATYTAAEVSLNVHAAMSAVPDITDPDYAASPDASASGPDDELAQLTRALRAAEARLDALAAQAARTLREIHSVTNPGPATAAEQESQAAAGLRELRADPLGTDIRLLFAVEPAGTATLLAVLEGEAAVTEHRDQAIDLAGELLTEIRAGEWPPDDAASAADIGITFADPATFVAKFFPDGSPIAGRAAALTSAMSIGALRRAKDMSLADLARQTGISERRLRFIEEDGLRVAQVHEAVACIRALGGRPELTARLDDSGPVVLY